MTSSRAPLVSILLPAFNESPRLIDACMMSISAQTLGDYECLVLDDSTDADCRERWDQCARDDSRVRVLRADRRLGLVASLNRGLSEAQGRYIARVDADDLSEPDRFAEQYKFMEACPQVDLVGCSAKVMSEDDLPVGVRDYPRDHDEIARGLGVLNMIAHPSVFARRAAFERLGKYDENFRYCEDLELWLRWLRKGARFANLPDRLVTLRVDANGRPRANWRFNFKARLRNFDNGRFANQAVGLLLAGGASLVPPELPRYLWDRLVVRSSPEKVGGV